MRKIGGMKTRGMLYLLCFAFPFLTMVSIFSILQLYPVGDRTMLTVDLYHQYAPFLCEFRQKILDGGSLFYSWNSGLGNEYYAAFANYTSSPLNIFVIFFTNKAVPVFIALVTCVRAGLASLFMAMFLSEEDRGNIDLITVVFASSYALCGWFVTDFWNIMWADALVLLPLICLGLRRLMLSRKYTLYVAGLATALISNYYTGYFICIFLVLFAPVLYLITHDPSSDDPSKRLCTRTFFASAGRFALGSVIAGMISSVILIPTYLILQHSSAVGTEFPNDYDLTGNMFDFLGRFMVSAHPNIRDGMANVSCGIIVVLLLPLFFAAGRKTGITLRHKIGLGILVFILYLSFTNRTLNFIWHGFHFPNQIPYRESFLMCFLLVYMAFMTIRVLRSFPRNYIAASVIGSFLFLVLYEKFGEGQEGYLQIGLTLLFIIVQGSVLLVVRDGRNHSPSYYEMLVMITVMAELFISTCSSVGQVAKNEGFTGYEFFGKNRNAVVGYTDSVEYTDGHFAFERSELYPNNICDIQSVYGVRGMSVFSSTARESFVKYMRNFGFHNNGINGLRNAGLTRVTATLLGIRNLIEIEDTSTVPMCFPVEYRDEDITVHGNPDALHIGYMVSPDLLLYEPRWEITDAFAKTNDLVRYMGVEADMYLPVGTSENGSTNVNYRGTNGNAQVYDIIDSNKETGISLTVNDADIGSDIFLYVNSSKGGRVTVTRADGTEVSYEIRSYQTISVGMFDGTPIEVNIRYSKSPIGTLNVNAYEINNEGYELMVSTLSAHQMDVIDYSDTYISGRIDAGQGGLLFLTVPYSDGFTMLVDGEESEIVPVSDAFCSVRLTAGEHSIILKYKPEGFDLSVAVTLIGLIAFAGVTGLSRMPKKAKAEVPAADDTETEE